jgi:hypothetical protein
MIVRLYFHNDRLRIEVACMRSRIQLILSGFILMARRVTNIAVEISLEITSDVACMQSSS